MSVAFGPVAVVAAVLAAGGFFKVRDPGPAAGLFTHLGVPAPRLLARLSGVVELVIGGAAVLVGGRWSAVAVAGSFTVLSAVTARVLSSPEHAPSCGCFGRLSARPSPVHLAANLVAAGLAGGAAVAAGEVPGAREAMAQAGNAGTAAVLVALVALAAWLWVAMLTVLADALDAARRLPRAPAPRAFDVGEGPW